MKVVNILAVALGAITATSEAVKLDKQSFFNMDQNTYDKLSQRQIDMRIRPFVSSIFDLAGKNDGGRHLISLDDVSTLFDSTEEIFEDVERSLDR